MGDAALLAVYLACLGFLAPFAWHRAWMLLRFRPWVRSDAGAPAGELPELTLQLPVYNEREVVERLFAAVAGLDYPRDRLQVQVLDDSTDATRALVDAGVERLRAGGIDAEVLRRPERTGFKAGALANGLATARGELIAVLDADFTPGAAFLRELAGRLQDPRAGMVQARWGHANRERSFLTRAQATLLDGQFVVEHTVRHGAGLFFNFNGTAGVWRRAAIEASGGWSADTLTEDLDLSFRAQLDGWRFVSAPDVEAPAELPAAMGAFKAQQHRWARGTVQVLRKLGGRVLRSEQRPAVRLDALGHLLAPCAHPAVLALGLVLPLLGGVAAPVPAPVGALLLVLLWLSIGSFYARAERALGRPFLARWLDTLAALTLGIGLSLSQSLAVAQGLFGGVGEFERTPKQGARGVSSYAARATVPAGAELILAAWCAWGLIEAVRAGAPGGLAFLALYTCGYGWVGAQSLRERLAPVSYTHAGPVPGPARETP